jgi:hypothetical protein
MLWKVQGYGVFVLEGEREEKKTAADSSLHGIRPHPCKEENQQCHSSIP